MGDLVSLKNWIDRRSGREDPEDEPVSPELISTIWFNKYGKLRAHVSLDGALNLEHDKPLPPAVMRDLARSTILYFNGLCRPPEQMDGTEQPLCAWLEGGKKAKLLKCIKPSALEVPFGATALALVVMDGPRPLIIGWVNYFPDERLIRSLKSKKLSSGQSHMP